VADPTLPVNCLHCEQPMHYIKDVPVPETVQFLLRAVAKLESTAQLYRCPEHGLLRLDPDGVLRPHWLA
jgi:hypothetical protein